MQIIIVAPEDAIQQISPLFARNNLSLSGLFGPEAPPQLNCYYTTEIKDGPQGEEFAHNLLETLRGIEGVAAAYIKPAAQLTDGWEVMSVE